MKKKISRILGVGVTLVIVCSLAIALAPAAPTSEVSADPGSQKWTKFVTPKPGNLTDYLLSTTAGTTAGPGPVAKGIDGTLYVYWDVEESRTLYKSTDNGRTWAKKGKYADIAIVDIACSTEDADLLYVANTTTVYRSNDGGSSFSEISPLSPYSDNVDEEITSLDVGYDGSSHWIIVGTARPTTIDGEVYIKQDPYLGPWQPQDITDNRAVRDVAAAPDFATANPLIVAVTDNGTTGTTGINQHTWVQYQWGGGAWTRATEIQFDTSATTTSTTGGNINSAHIVFPADFDSEWDQGNYFVGINSANVAAGDVYNVVGSQTVLDLDIDGSNSATNVRSIALAGSAGDTMLLAGEADGPNVYHSEDNGDTWYDSKYDPSGAAQNIYVAVADDYYDSGIGWAAVGGAQGAFSQTDTFGKYWYQISLVATSVDTISDLAFSPAYADDSTMFMVSANTVSTTESLWRNDGTYWERVCDDNTQDLAGIDGVQVSPNFATDSAVFIADTTTRKLWRAVDGGYRFKKQAGAPSSVGTGWLVIDSSRQLWSKGDHKVWLTENNGTTWEDNTASGATDATNFAISPDYDNDSTVLMGDTTGRVYLSDDAGGGWDQIPAGEVVESGATTVYVAFDTDYANNATVYSAAPNMSDVYRLEVGEDTTWGNIDGRGAITWPGDSLGATTALSGLATGNGVVYAADDGSLDMAAIRSQNPTAGRSVARGVFFERMGWSPEANSSSLWVTAGEDSNVLWTLKATSGSTYDMIWAYEDALLVGPTLLSPEEGFSTGRETEATLTWEELPKAKYYFVWVSSDEEFSVSEIQSARYISGYPWNATTSTTSFKVSGLGSGKTYYWKICTADSEWGNHSSANATESSARGSALSPWSEVRSFSTGITGGEWNPFRTPEGYAGNVAPAPGATGVTLKPPFQWNAADWATGYEFVLADNSAYTAPVVSKTGAAALETTTYALDTELAYSTSYYWKVRAISATTDSVWGEGVFTTMAKPVAPTPPVVVEPTPPAPAPVQVPILPLWVVWAIIGIGAVLVIAVIILIVRTRRVV